MIVIEGSDLVGKTTFAKELMQYKTAWGPFKYRHLGLLPGDWHYYRDYINRGDYLTINDRFYLSELVYGEVCRGRSFVTNEAAAQITTELVKMYGLHTLIITADDEVLTENFNQRGEDLYKLEQILAVNKQFKGLAANLVQEAPNNFWWYNMEKGRPWASAHPTLAVDFLNQWSLKQSEFWEEHG